MISWSQDLLSKWVNWCRSVEGMKLMGYNYIGFEVGHVARCGYNKPEHAESYGA
jgi:hypothetical protein